MRYDTYVSTSELPLIGKPLIRQGLQTQGRVFERKARLGTAVASSVLRQEKFQVFVTAV
jgi:hypothetical protein